MSRKFLNLPPCQDLNEAEEKHHILRVIPVPKMEHIGQSPHLAKIPEMKSISKPQLLVEVYII